MTYPRSKSGQSLKDHQAEMAAWMGASSVQEMNRAHDPLHLTLANFFCVPSHALRQAAGEDMSASEYHLAAIEEEAVLYVQRWITQAKGKFP